MSDRTPPTPGSGSLAADPEVKALVKQAIAEDKTARFTFHDLSDAGLARVMRQYRRDIEDEVRVRSARHWLAAARFVFLLRAKLRMRYGAQHRYEGGTASYDQYVRLSAPPSYELAWMLYSNRHLRAVRRLP